MQQPSKPIDVIPKGPYCYSGHLGTNRCPYYGVKNVGGVPITWCRFLQQGSLGDLTDKEFQHLKDFHKTTSDEDIWELYPLDLLWDQVKECGENEEDE